MGAKFIFKQ